MQQCLTRQVCLHKLDGDLARIPLISFTEASEEHLASAARRLAEVGRGVEAAHEALANSPSALSAFIEMSAYIRNGSSVPRRTREILALATAAARGSEFVWESHVPLARAASVTDEQIEAIALWPAKHEALHGLDRACVELCHQLAASAGGADAACAAVEQELAPAELVDLLLTIGWYQLCATLFGALAVLPTPAALSPAPTPTRT